ncbi:Ribonuclease G [Candidatus Xiphinematobacter sp. Idaho Grape]|uniref:Rne/Rng family ribonuclease n=1 Tax=Candidatus Xiphinematobacter sp. Idaho Grape TaxID=1704307 RepID=UPI0007066B54|nr:Rne/Rng family ribonuclease [Candidatus Xiphinematobacter sp. Idaho Grape]ALJ56802.1 Ribonuclease G [Candidatus Xiphinematobacter sp. Idaho Grape]
MIESVKRLLGFGKKKLDIILVVSCEKLEKRVALLEGGLLEEYSTERETERNVVGAIFKGKVRNIEPGIKAMFVDIGFGKNAFLQFWDAIPAALDSGVETISRGGKEKNPPASKRVTAKDVPSIYPVGSEIMVQVRKGPISNKGPRITTDISLPGRYLVLMPFNDQCGISRKIEDPRERERLRTILRKLRLPEGIGLIIRTIGQKQRERFFVRDLSLLLEQWQQIQTGMEEKTAPAVLSSEPDLIDRTVRDFLTDSVDAVYLDDRQACERMQTLIGHISRRARNKVHLYSGQQPIFESFGVQKQIEAAFLQKVWLPCGGYIVIDETEAMIAVDVNTGRNKGTKDIGKTILQTNLEAADEIARQLRLRNIGGIIVADFIDMKNRRDQQAVYQRLRERLRRDKARTNVLPISPLGLMEMTRQRAKESLASVHYLGCPYCHGHGTVKSPTTMSVELQRAIHSVMRRHVNSVHEIRITVHPDLLSRLRTEDEELLLDIERHYAVRLSFRTDPNFHHERFTILNAITNEEMGP